MRETIAAIFMSIITFFMSLFGIVPGADVAKNFAYDTVASRQVMDIYIPKNAKGSARDVLLFIHGGSWTGGDKSAYAGGCAEMVKQGLVCATMNYRLFDSNKGIQQDITFWDMVDDIDSALIALKAELIQRGITPKRLVISGASAGGHLTMLYAYTHSITSPIPLAFIMPDAGPADFTDPGYFEAPRSPAQSYLLSSMILKEAVTAETFALVTDKLLAVSPISYITANAPPTLLRYGGQDDLVPASNGQRMKAKLDSVGVRNDLLIYERSGHALDNIANKPGTDYEINQEYQKLVEKYRKDYLG